MQLFINIRLPGPRASIHSRWPPSSDSTLMFQKMVCPFFKTRWSQTSILVQMICKFINKKEICLPLYAIISVQINPNTLEPRYNTIRYNTNSDITRMRVGPQFLPNLPFSYLLNVSMFSKRVNTVIKTVNYIILTLSQLSKLSHPFLSPSILR